VIGELEAMRPRFVLRHIKMGTDGVEVGYIDDSLCGWRLRPGLNIATVLVLAGLDAIWIDVRVPAPGRHTGYMW